MNILSIITFLETCTNLTRDTIINDITSADIMRYEVLEHYANTGRRNNENTYSNNRNRK